LNELATDVAPYPFAMAGPKIANAMTVELLTDTQ
jgi:hypothetical protein